MGALIMVYSLTNDTNVLYIFAPRVYKINQINSSIIGLTNHEYRVSVFVIQENQLPFHRVAVLPRSIRVNVIRGMILILNP